MKTWGCLFFATAIVAGRLGAMPAAAQSASPPAPVVTSPALPPGATAPPNGSGTSPWRPTIILDSETTKRLLFTPSPAPGKRAKSKPTPRPKPGRSAEVFEHITTGN